MKMSEVLLIKLDTNGFERFYNRKMQECGCTVLRSVISAGKNTA